MKNKISIFISIIITIFTLAVIKQIILYKEKPKLRYFLVCYKSRDIVGFTTLSSERMLNEKIFRDYKLPDTVMITSLFEFKDSVDFYNFRR